MKRIHIILIFLVTVSLGLAQKPVSGLKFNHQIHKENEVECSTCHSTVSESVKGADNLIPEMDVCADCHDIESEDNCTMCHIDVENNPTGVRFTDYNQKFSHAMHLGKVEDCSTCHQKKDDVTYVIPAMSDCMTCHNSKNVSTECSTCHLPGENLKPANHAGNFLHTHGQLARSRGMTAHKAMDCNTCHTVNQCQECHQGENLDRLTHPLNFSFTHSFEARGKEKQCLTCHTERSFCIECHRENQVLPGSHRAGWINNIPGDGGRHKVEARVNLEECMACHEANASVICQPCHGN